MTFLRQLIFLIIFQFSSLLSSATVNNGVFLPDFCCQATPIFNDCTGGSLLVEAGRKNLRLNGTLGLLFNGDERAKVSLEFLQQKFDYRFREFHRSKKMQQVALGLSYQQDFCFSYLRKGEITGYLSYSPGKRIRSSFFNDRIHSRHIDGANAYGGEVNVEVALWNSCAVTLGLDYDGIVFHRKFDARKYLAGFGGSVNFCQSFTDCLALSLKAEFRRPYNYFAANLNWLPVSCLSCGLFGTYTNGKSRLPNVATAGLEIHYAFSLNSCHGEDCAASLLSCWVGKPAVCLPEIFAIADERICRFPESVAIPPFTITATGFYAINVAPFFFNPDNLPLVFSASGLPAGSSINELTGVISGFNPQNGLAYPITVTASKSCASTSQSFTITYL